MKLNLLVLAVAVIGGCSNGPAEVKIVNKSKSPVKVSYQIAADGKSLLATVPAQSTGALPRTLGGLGTIARIEFDDGRGGYVFKNSDRERIAAFCGTRCSIIYHDQGNLKLDPS